MSSIKITFKDGTVKTFPHEGRAGGSYSKSVSYEGAMVVINDEYGKRTAFPVDDIKQVDEYPHRY